MLCGKLIVFEGVDGAGTTTQATLLREKFVQNGLPALVTAQPSRGPVGALIRQILQGRLVTVSHRPPGWSTMSLLFAADRQDHQENEIEPNLRDGVNVICDRYVQSSVMYQSVSAGDSEVVNWILEINRHIMPPDLVVQLRISAGEAARRRASRGGAEEIFDDDGFQEKLIKAYEQLPALFPDVPILVIDAALSQEEISSKVWDAVTEIRNNGGGQ